MELSKELLSEFFEHPVTARLVELIHLRQEIAEDSRSAAFVRGDSGMTQENNCFLEGAIAELSLFLEALEDEDIELLKYEDDDDED